MMHELKNIILKAKQNEDIGIQSVMATVVDLTGSSYRKPGVRMLISENGEMTGALSGGCVESEIARRADSVFQTGISKIMRYDGRFKLGCEGILYIVIEKIQISELFFQQFQLALNERSSLQISVSYSTIDNDEGDFGSVITFKNNKKIPFLNDLTTNAEERDWYHQVIKPCFKLIIFGGGDDAAKLCSQAAAVGWQVEIITTGKNIHPSVHLSKAEKISEITPELLNLNFDKDMAVILMTHNYALDLQYLIKILKTPVPYLGIIGSRKRKEHIFNDLINYLPEIDEPTLDKIFSPAGLNIGAITPEEIAVSILAEIIAFRNEIKKNISKSINSENIN